MAALHITKENFEGEVLKSDIPVLVDFWAAWCGPCKMLMPIIEELAGEVTGVKICKVNVDEEPELAAKYQVMTIPTLVVIKDGEVMKKSSGVISKNAILDMINA
ncbi:MAG: thioredoxin [Lachnospiraceae bacterium]|nr:thioredoxin [Lachnospiraceae bacterium]